MEPTIKHITGLFILYAIYMGIFTMMARSGNPYKYTKVNLVGSAAAVLGVIAGVGYLVYVAILLIKT
jgi:hypothetical protein